jgi:hypothetical protein
VDHKAPSSADAYAPASVLEILVRAMLTYAAAMACLGVPVLALRTLAPAANQLPWIGGAAFSLLMLVVLWHIGDKLARWFSFICAAIARVPEGRWLAICLSAGLLLRTAWIWAVPGIPTSDGAIYINLARKLLAGGPYVAAGTHAYWPPGYALFLMPWLAAIPGDRLAIAASNLALFVVGAEGVWKLGRLALSPGSARVALLVFSLWPNLAFQSGMPEKEQVLVALLPWIIALAFVRDSNPPRRWKVLLAGLLVGAAALVQPILELFPAVLLCYWLLCFRRVIVPIRMTMLALVGMVLVITPWTIRNYLVLDQFVFISTNGGLNLYGANNPIATGRYLEHWPDDLVRMPELEADREGKRRAAAWIVSNPDRFLALAFEKNILFMGDDAVGPYQTMKRGMGSSSELAYAVVKAGSNLYWLAAWSLLLAGLLAIWRHRKRVSPDLLLIPLAFLYFFLLHSIVESSGKYHVLTIGVLSVLIPMILEVSGPWPTATTIKPPKGST